MFNKSTKNERMTPWKHQPSLYVDNWISARGANVAPSANVHTKRSISTVWKVWMVHSERRAEVWRQSPQRVQGTSPGQGVRRRSPWSWKPLLFKGGAKFTIFLVVITSCSITSITSTQNGQEPFSLVLWY